MEMQEIAANQPMPVDMFQNTKWNDLANCLQALLSINFDVIASMLTDVEGHKLIPDSLVDSALRVCFRPLLCVLIILTIVFWGGVCSLDRMHLILYYLIFYCLQDEQIVRHVAANYLSQAWQQAFSLNLIPIGARLAHNETMHHITMIKAFASLIQEPLEPMLPIHYNALMPRTQLTKLLAAMKDDFGSELHGFMTENENDVDDWAVGVKWRKILRSLTEERGPWVTDADAKKLVYWKLDKAEDRLRMRRKLRRNYRFVAHEPCTPRLVRRDKSTEEFENKDAKDDGSITWPKLPMLQIDDTEKFDEEFASATTEEDGRIVADGNSNAIILQTECDLVKPIRVYHGVLQISSTHIRFEGVPVIEPHTRKNSPEPDAEVKRKVKRFVIKDIQTIHFRRYLLRKTAMEIFLVDNCNYFFNFRDKVERNKVFQKIRAASAVLAPSINGGVSKAAPISMDCAKSPQERFRTLRDITERWQNRSISNFEYLMYLNTLAGRSYNDITQYPVFPWILSDYVSEKLDLSNPNVFRDLSKPIGALEEKRLDYFRDRFKNFEDPDGVIPPFFYGSHYSSAGVVMYYLVRMEPFATGAVELQGGHFDHTDRMFDSIAHTWDNVLHHSADVKELIPELFYCPEMFINSNNFDFGSSQNGKVMADCVLPPWSEGDPHKFVYLHREALESEYVSQHLHEWIDLIFGYKQTGKDAVDAFNIFYYLTYEGAVDIDSIKDPMQRKAFEKQIENFGQTPSQLLRRPHPARRPLDTLMLTTLGRVKATTMKLSGSTRITTDMTFNPGDTTGPMRCERTVDPSKDFSITCRIRTPATEGVIMCKWPFGSDPRDYFELGDAVQGMVLCVSGGRVRLLIGSPKTLLLDMASHSKVTGDSWHSVVVTYNRTEHRFVIYIDGIVESVLRVADRFDVPESAPLFVAGGVSEIGNQRIIPSLFHGSIFELSWHPSTLSQAHVIQIASLFVMMSLHEPPRRLSVVHHPEDNRHEGEANARRIVYVHSAPDRIVTIDECRCMAIHKWSPVSRGFSDRPFLFEADPLVASRKRIGVPFANVRVSNQLFSLTSDGKHVVSAGHWDNTFRITSVETGRVVAVVNQHKDVVTCVDVSLKNTMIVSGSKDTTVMVWYEEKGITFGTFDKPRNVLFGHADEVTCVSANAGMDVIVSGSLDGTCIVHTLRKGRYVRSINHPNNYPIDLIAVSNSGDIVMYSEKDLSLHMFSINGAAKASSSTAEKLHTMIITSSEHLLTGGDKGHLVIRSLHDLQITYKLPTKNCALVSLALTPEEQHVLVGLADGSLCTFSLQPSESRKQNIISTLDVIL
jgi:WD40 repeat protein